MGPAGGGFSGKGNGKPLAENYLEVPPTTHLLRLAGWLPLTTTDRLSCAVRCVSVCLAIRHHG